MWKLYLLLTGMIFSASVNAQDANYWSAAYNPAGFLTPGAAVAFTGDSGVLYFNPALLAYNTKNSATISGSVYQFNTMSIKDGAGNGLNLKSSNVSVVPVMASSILSIKGKKRFTIAYALIHNPVIAYQTTQQLDGKYNVLNDSYSPGAENFLAQYSSQNLINETSGLLSTGFQLSPNVAAGFSMEGVYREQHKEENYSARALINVPSNGLPPIADAQTLYQITHYNVSLKFKAGFAYDKGRDHLGLTITSPLVKIFSNGQLLVDYLFTDLRLSQTDTMNMLASTRQTKLKEKYRMPLSIAGGYARETSWGRVYVSAEYFSSVKEYNVITPRASAFIRTNDDENIFTSDALAFQDARRSVINVGVGVSYQLKPDLTGFVALRTDRSYADSSRYTGDVGFVSNTSNFDIYHLQLGGNVRRRRFNLRAGLLLDYARTSKFLQPVSMNSANEQNLLLGDVHNTRASYFSVGLMFAYIHNL
ncbi:MAG TPA: hypothetical protein VL727_23180 [Puia sp.]|nr:hypothetical protein [Puia sp.]